MTSRFRWTDNENRVYDLIHARTRDTPAVRLTLTELSTELGVNRKTLHHTLTTLERAGIIENLDPNAGRRGCTYRIVVEA